MNITIGTKFQLNLIIFTFWTKFAQKGISGRKRKNRTCACVHGRYLLYKTFPHRGRQTKRYFNVSAPFSYRNNNCQIDWLYKSLKRIWSKNAEKFKFCCEYCEIFKRIKEFPRISWVTMEVESFSTDLLQTGRGGELLFCWELSLLWMIGVGFEKIVWWTITFDAVSKYVQLFLKTKTFINSFFTIKGCFKHYYVCRTPVINSPGDCNHSLYDLGMMILLK